jgi:hypothetical protein
MAAGSLLGVYFLTTYLYVGAIVLLVGSSWTSSCGRMCRATRSEASSIVREVV